MTHLMIRHIKYTFFNHKSQEKERLYFFFCQWCHFIVHYTCISIVLYFINQEKRRIKFTPLTFHLGQVFVIHLRQHCVQWPHTKKCRQQIETN